MVVDERVVVENKATEKLSPADRVQLVSYLRASSFAVGVLLHCGPTPRFSGSSTIPRTRGNTTRMIAASKHAARSEGRFVSFVRFVHNVLERDSAWSIPIPRPRRAKNLCQL
jgi:hypothetical protein